MPKNRSGVAPRLKNSSNGHQAERPAAPLKKKSPSEQTSPARSLAPQLTAGEVNVLRVFENYLMTPGKMLCFNAQDQETYKVPLAHLTSTGLLVSEQLKGGYSLSDTGYSAMQGRR